MRLRRLVLALLLAGLPGLAAAQGDPSFNLVNRSGQAINEIYVSAVTDTNWGRDLLGQDVLPNGRSFPVRIAPATGCRQDIRVVYADRRVEERRNQDTCAIAEMVFGAAAPQAGQTPPSQQRAQQAATNPSFNLVNHGRAAMREIYVSSARQDSWGDQRLAQPMQPGAHLAVRLPVGDCLNDVLVVWADGRREERRRVDTCRIVNLVFN
jgi:hypothetical protein